MWVTLARVPDSPAHPVGVIKQTSAVVRSGLHMFMVHNTLPKADPGPMSKKLRHVEKGFTFYVLLL